MTGLYINRVNPEDVKAYWDRELEKKQEEADKLAKEEMKKNLMEKYIAEYNSTAWVSKGTKIERKIREELNPQTQAEKVEATKIIKEFRVIREYSDNEKVKNIFYANTIKEKLLMFADLKENSTQEEYKNIVRDLKNKEIISSQLWKELKAQDNPK